MNLQSFKKRNNILVDELKGLDFLRVAYQEEIGYNPSLDHRLSPSGNEYLTRVFGILDIKKDARISDIGYGKGSAIRTFLNFPIEKQMALK